MKAERDRDLRVTRVTLVCGCHFVASDEALLQLVVDYGVTFEQFCSRVFALHDCRTPRRALTVTFERGRRVGEDWLHMNVAPGMGGSLSPSAAAIERMMAEDAQ